MKCGIDLSSLIGFDVLDLRTQKDERSELDGLNNTNQKACMKVMHENVIDLSSLDGFIQ